MGKNRTFLICILAIVAFAFLAPVIPFSARYDTPALIRDQCVGEVGPSSPADVMYVSITWYASGLLTIPLALGHRIDVGMIYLPKGVPFATDVVALYFPPFTNKPAIECG